MKYLLTPIDCRNIAAGHQPAIDALVRRIRSSQDVSHIQFPYCESLKNPGMARALVQFLHGLGTVARQ